MSRFKVGDKVLHRNNDRTYTIEAVDFAYVGKDGESIYRINWGGGCAFGWYAERDLLPIPVKKRYEVVRVVEAEDEAEALTIAMSREKAVDHRDFIAREVK